MPRRLLAVESNEAQLADAGLLRHEFAEGYAPTNRVENAYRTARAWTALQPWGLDDLEEKRLETALARVVARDAAAHVGIPAEGEAGGARLIEAMELSSVDYARMMIVDASLQRGAHEALELDMLDRKDKFSWINPEVENEPWFRAGVSPTELLSLSEMDLAHVADGTFDGLSSYQRENVELMLLGAASGRDDNFDLELHRENEIAFFGKAVRLYEFTPGSDVSVVANRCRMLDDERFMTHPNIGGLSPKEVEGVVDRLSLARFADSHKDGNPSLYDGRQGRNRFEVSDADKRFGHDVTMAAGNGHVRNQFERVARVALEYQQERGIPLDRAATKRMEGAIARLRRDRMGENSMEAVQQVLMDTAAQAMASEKLNRPVLFGRQREPSPSELIATDLVGRGRAPIFTRMHSEREDTVAVSMGRFEDLTDDRGIGSSVRKAMFLSTREVSEGGVSARVTALLEANPVGKTQEIGWIDHKAAALDGQSKLQSLTRGPAQADLLGDNRSAGVGR